MNIVLLFFKQLPNSFFLKILIIKQIVKLLLTVTFVYIYDSFFSLPIWSYIFIVQHIQVLVVTCNRG